MTCGIASHKHYESSWCKAPVTEPLGHRIVAFAAISLWTGNASNGSEERRRSIGGRLPILIVAGCTAVVVGNWLTRRKS
jgi:hypothetical protein